LPHKNHFKIGSEDVQPYLLGDFAYYLQIGLMKCFSSKATCTPQQNLFDRKWRVGRFKIENAFGSLKYKFQILRNLNMGLDYVPTIIMYQQCCILHNFLIPKGPRPFFSKNTPNLPFLAQEAQMNFFSLFALSTMKSCPTLLREHVQKVS
jgi:hypothetical protein